MAKTTEKETNAAKKGLSLKEQEALIHEEIQRFIALSKTKETLTIEEINEALASNYLLVSVSFKSWAGKRTDRDATDELTAAVEKDVARPPIEVLGSDVLPLAAALVPAVSAGYQSLE